MKKKNFNFAYKKLLSLPIENIGIFNKTPIKPRKSSLSESRSSASTTVDSIKQFSEEKFVNLVEQRSSIFKSNPSTPKSLINKMNKDNKIVFKQVEESQAEYVSEKQSIRSAKLQKEFKRISKFKIVYDDEEFNLVKNKKFINRQNKSRCKSLENLDEIDEVQNELCVDRQPLKYLIDKNEFNETYSHNLQKVDDEKKDIKQSENTIDEEQEFQNSEQKKTTKMNFNLKVDELVRKMSWRDQIKQNEDQENQSEISIIEEDNENEKENKQNSKIPFNLKVDELDKQIKNKWRNQFEEDFENQTSEIHVIEEDNEKNCYQKMQRGSIFEKQKEYLNRIIKGGDFKDILYLKLIKYHFLPKVDEIIEETNSESETDDTLIYKYPNSFEVIEEDADEC